jgi:sigma54-dependent transcription regulator
MTEPVQSDPDIEEPAWSCVVTINGHVRGSVTGKQSRQESMEAAAKEALTFLSQLGYQSTTNY